MINKLHLAVMTPEGLKDAEVYKNDNVGYVCICGERVHYCDSDLTLFSFIQDFIDLLQAYPTYENKK